MDRRLRFALSVALLLGGCFVDRSGLAGGPTDAAPPDAPRADAQPGGDDGGGTDAGPTPVDASVDGGDGSRDAGTDAGTDAGMDAGTDAGTDAGPPDSGPPDAGPPDGGPPPCNDIFSGISGLHLCAERPAQCEYYVALGGRSCTGICTTAGATCLGSFDESSDTGSGRCVRDSSDRGCGDTATDRICLCTRPHLP